MMALEERARLVREARERAAAAGPAVAAEAPGRGELVSLADFLGKRGWQPPACVVCHDSGRRRDRAARYTVQGVLADDAICDCEAGARERERQNAIRGERERQEAEKRQTRANRLFAQSGVPPFMAGWTLASYPGDARLASLAQRYIEEGRLDDGARVKLGLLLLGPSGTGKTGLAVAVVNARIAAGVPSLFVETGAFLRQIRATFDRRSAVSTEAVTGAAREIDFLVLDDVGDVGRGGNPASDFARAEIFDLVNHRHNAMLPTLLTSNLSAKQLADQFGDRTWWRIAEMCLVAEVRGKNLRA